MTNVRDDERRTETETKTEAAIAQVAFQDDDPYADVDVSSLPEWWQHNLREFAEHDLQTYLPSRFADGAIVQREVERLTATCGVDIQLVGVGVTHGDDWEVRVDGESVGSVSRRRVPLGYTVFELTSEAFERLVCDPREA